jgi:hypothetical protein
MQKLQQSSGCAKYGILFFGLLWTGISCFTIIPIIAASGGAGLSLAALNEPAALLGALGTLAFPLGFGGCFLLIGLLITLAGLRPIIAGTRVSPPEVQVSSTNLRSGDEFTLSYQQTFKAASDVERITMQLILRESATYRRGTKTVTVTHDHIVQAFETPARHFEGGETFNDMKRLVIPRGAMHSFEARRNKLRWLLKVKVEIKGWPDYEDEYVLKVLPELA